VISHAGEKLRSLLEPLLVPIHLWNIALSTQLATAARSGRQR
jgi:hypothetical protein